jgi:hypothetical protein
LHDVIVDSQTKLLDAAIAAGKNRNFDLRKKFYQYLDKSSITYGASTAIAATSIMNGAFADILSYATPAMKSIVSILKVKIVEAIAFLSWLFR